MGTTSLREPKYGTGYKPDTHDKSKDLSSKHLFGARVGLPTEAMVLEQFIGEVWDQLMSSSCVGHAFARAIMLRCAMMKTPIARPSAEAIYTFARCIDRDDPTVALTDDGSMPNQAVRGMAEWGVPTAAEWPLDMETINEDPDLEELERAAEFVIHGTYRIDTDGADRVADICQALAAGYPVAVGTAVGHSFEDYNGRGVVSAHTDSVGGHMLCLHGYKTDPTSKGRVFRGVNSWNSTWGDRGLFWADETFIKDVAMSDIYVVQCSKA